MALWGMSYSSIILRKNRNIKDIGSCCYSLQNIINANMQVIWFNNNVLRYCDALSKLSVAVTHILCQEYCQQLGNTPSKRILPFTALNERIWSSVRYINMHLPFSLTFLYNRSSLGNCHLLSLSLLTSTWSKEEQKINVKLLPHNKLNQHIIVRCQFKSKQMTDRIFFPLLSYLCRRLQNEILLMPFVWDWTGRSHPGPSQPLA